MRSKTELGTPGSRFVVTVGDKSLEDSCLCIDFVYTFTFFLERILRLYSRLSDTFCTAGISDMSRVIPRIIHPLKCTRPTHVEHIRPGFTVRDSFLFPT